MCVPAADYGMSGKDKGMKLMRVRSNGFGDCVWSSLLRKDKGKAKFLLLFLDEKKQKSHT
jgi:hypothetical protein